MRLLAAARDRRAPLDLDLPERKIVLDGAGPGRARDDAPSGSRRIA